MATLPLRVDIPLVVVPELNVAVPLVVVLAVLVTFPLLVTVALLVTAPLVVSVPLVVISDVVRFPRLRVAPESDVIIDVTTPVLVAILAATTEFISVVPITPLTLLVSIVPDVESVLLVIISPVPIDPHTLLVMVLPDEASVLRVLRFVMVASVIDPDEILAEVLVRLEIVPELAEIVSVVTPDAVI
jgi:hypothetical protein